MGVFSLILILLLRNQVTAKTKELQETNEVPRESEQKMRLHLEFTLSVPWEYDLKRETFSYVVPQEGEVFGYPPESWTDFASWKRKLHPEDREWVPGYCIRETVGGRDYEVTCRVVTPDNRVMWVQGVVAVLSGPGGPERLIGFSRESRRARRRKRPFKRAKRGIVSSLKILLRWFGRWTG